MEENYCYNTEGKVAILIDGGYFLKRLSVLKPKDQQWDALYVSKMLRILCSEHAKKLRQNIYRIFYYDCPPISDGIHNIITNKFVKFKDSPQYIFRNELFKELKRMRKMALRLGVLSRDRDNPWIISPSKMTMLLKGEIQVCDLDPQKDLILNVRQKQVDLKIGIDIATMTLKKQVSTMILVAGDGDFVPAAKMARREGIDFILDPMWGNIQPDLNEHVDGIHSSLFRPSKKTKKSEGDESVQSSETL